MKINSEQYFDIRQNYSGMKYTINYIKMHLHSGFEYEIDGNMVV